METRKDNRKVLAEDPFIFYPQPPDWRWLSFAEAAEGVETWRASLSGLAAGARVGIAGSPSGAALVADIAVRASGLVAVPLADSEIEMSDSGCVDCILDLEAYELRTFPVPPATAGTANGASPQRPASSWSNGGCVVWRGAARDCAPVLLRRERLESAVERMGRDIGVLRERPIVVHGRSLGDAGERVVVEWAIHEAAAIVIAAPGTEMSVAGWVRPTLLQGSPAELGEWIRSCTAERHGKLVLERRFRRLAAVVVLADETVDEETSRQWQEVGVRVVNAPTLGSAGDDRL
ncbi:MAG: hypothetical protein OEM62_05785 [Acidobacteriota bacterium]|nr:hypothetical protein [Acidobacteriota bacterium]